MGSCNQQRASEYLKTLFEIKISIAGKAHQEQDREWLAHFHKGTSDGYISTRLPELLALIHPDFYYKNGTPLEGSLPWKNNGFAAGITQTDRCRAEVYTGVECLFNQNPQIRGKCHADHVWPNSLGGPSILDNRLVLCKYHNGMKSNDIAHFNWTIIPNWLESYLQKLYRLKS